MAMQDNATDPIDLAFTLHTTGRLAEAEAIYRRIISDGGAAAAGARNNLMGLLWQQERWADAEAFIRETLGALPSDPDWTFRLASSRLMAGDYAEGWPLYEARRGTSKLRVTPPQLTFPEWRGEPVRTLLLWPEQGFGDVLQFARYVPLVKARGITPTILCPPALARLFTALDVPLISGSGALTIPDHDAWCLIGSLPGMFGTRLDSIPSAAYLPRGHGGGGIGFATAGKAIPNPTRTMDAASAERLAAVTGGRSLLPQHTGARDFRDTAEIIAGLDLVISIDTSIAHLAGAMGKPVWILLSTPRVDWRWQRGRSDSPWYPSARLFRQPSPGDWRAVVDQVESTLSA